LPLIIHPGGPGADVRAAVSRARELLAPIIDDFDIYALSTRGSVDGEAFDCGSSLDDLRIVDTEVIAALRFAEVCISRSGDLVGRVGTLDTVDDLEDFRRALGLQQVRFLGWSYGATVGAAWAMTHPSSIRRIVLDAPNDPRMKRVDSLRRQMDGASDAFLRIANGSDVETSGLMSREIALARDYVLYDGEFDRVAETSTSTLVELRLGETPDGNNDGGIETQIGVHCSDTSRADTEDALTLVEPTPAVGFGTVFDRVCRELPEPPRPLSKLAVDDRVTLVDALIVATSGDHVVPAEVRGHVVASTRRRCATAPLGGFRRQGNEDCDGISRHRRLISGRSVPAVPHRACEPTFSCCRN
jgi:pimeloyl-ACP methyl ester carboxylesterase